MLRDYLITLVAFLTFAGPSISEAELSFYGGWQGAPHSVVSGSDSSAGGIGDFDFVAGWEGRPMAMPPYYGMRYTTWESATFGWGVELNHAKVYADDATISDNGLTHFEFSDGLNLLTVNAFRRWGETASNFTPYVGAGVGLAIPHVEWDSGGDFTFGYQVTGPAVQWIAGASYPLNDRWSVFGEYKGSYSVNNAELDGGGSLSTNIVTNAFNLGVSLGF
ncbi:MAG: outer membrane beta-barrel protein [Paracoccaceae bacterium]|nr:outer membrane beta-barrel protein [Paracoccaceae bacterium]